MSRPHETLFGNPVFITDVKNYMRAFDCNLSEAVTVKYKQYWFENAEAATTFEELKRCVLDLGQRSLKT